MGAEPDAFLEVAAAYPVPRGRPSEKRKKGLVESFTKKKKAAKIASAKGATSEGDSK